MLHKVELLQVTLLECKIRLNNNIRIAAQYWMNWIATSFGGWGSGLIWMVILRWGLDRANVMAQILDRSDHPTILTGQ